MPCYGSPMSSGPVFRRRTLIAGLAGTALGAGALTACSSSTPEEGSTEPELRTVQHPLGSTEIPVRPQRVVCLDSGVSLQTALEVGAPVVASETLAGDITVPTYLPEPPEGFTALGFNEQNLEQIASLEPDLIIGSRVRVEELYDQLTAVAPTVAVLNSADGAVWEESAATVGDLVGAADRVAERIEEFETAAAGFAEKHAATLESHRVALIRFADEVRIVTGAVFPSHLLELLGVQRPESNTPPDEATTYISLSQEEVGVIEDADIILHFSGGGGFTRQDGGTGAEVTGGPLWQRLPAVRAGHAYELDAVTWWDGASVAAGLAGIAELDEILGSL